MPTDYSLEVRRSVVACLQGYAPLTGLVSANRIFGEYAKNPTWPFIRYGLPITEGFEATGWDGSEHDVTIHVFFNGPTTDQVDGAAKQVVEAMKGWQSPVGTGIVTAEWAGTQVLRDSPEDQAAKYHAVIRFAIAVAA